MAAAGKEKELVVLVVVCSSLSFIFQGGSNSGNCAAGFGTCCVIV